MTAKPRGKRTLRDLTQGEVTKLGETLEKIERRSTFTMEGPAAWPGGVILSPDVWYRLNGEGEWKFLEDEASFLFYNTGDCVDYIFLDENEQMIHVHWYGEET